MEDGPADPVPGPTAAAISGWAVFAVQESLVSEEIVHDLDACEVTVDGEELNPEQESLEVDAARLQPKGMEVSHSDLGVTFTGERPQRPVGCGVGRREPESFPCPFLGPQDLESVLEEMGKGPFPRVGRGSAGTPCLMSCPVLGRGQRSGTWHVPSRGKTPCTPGTRSCSGKARMRARRLRSPGS